MGFLRKVAFISTGGVSEVVKPAARVSKVVVYPLMPIVPIAKSLTVGTRRGNQGRAEIKKQTGLLEKQNRLQAEQNMILSAQASSGTTMVTPDGRFVSYDGGETYQPTNQQHAEVNERHAADNARFAVACNGCNAPLRMAGGNTSYVCPQCAATIFMRRCPGCSQVVSVPGRLVGQYVKCGNCGTTKAWKVWDQRPGRAAEFGTLVPAASPPPPAPPPAVPAVVASVSVADELSKLAKLRDDGILSEAEFASTKARLLA